MLYVWLMIIPFSYIITFVSLIYGLALTHALSCIAELIQNRNKIQNYWLWWIWAVWFILLSIGFWMSVYAYWHDCEKWSMLKFSFVTIQACLFYFCYYSFFNRKDEINNSLEYSFNENKRIVFILLGLLFLTMFVISPIISETDKDFGPNMKFSSFLLPALFWVFAFIKNKIANYIFALFMLSQFILQILFL